MNGFQPYVPVSTSLKKLNPSSSILRFSQKGSGAAPSINIVSPTEHVIAQAKENLKRNKAEASTGGGSCVKKYKSSPELKKTAPKKKKSNKSQKVHKRYGKKK